MTGETRTGMRGCERLGLSLTLARCLPRLLDESVRATPRAWS
jgi:hypothetical protein